MKNQLVMSAIASLVLVGCSDQLNEDDSRVAFVAASSVVSEGSLQAQTSAPTAGRGGVAPPRKML